MEDFGLALERFNISPLPDPAGDKYEERLTNWFLEGAFIRDFVYREQKGKGNKGDLADGLVLYRKTALFVQSKAQVGAQDGRVWAKKNIEAAMKQASYGERMLRQRLVPEVFSDTLGPVKFDPDRYTERIGLVVIRQEDRTPFAATELVPDLAQQKFPVHVISLEDLIVVLTRFDTAEDFLWYLEERRLLALGGVPLRVHEEELMFRAMLDLLPQRMRQRRPDISDAVFEESLKAHQSKLTGTLRASDHWRRSVVVDDIIARMHENDPDLPWAKGSTKADAMKLAEQLSCLDRYRRLLIGKRLLDAVRDCGVGSYRAFYRGLRWNGCCYMFLVMDGDRGKRLDLCRVFLAAAMARSGMEIGVAVATNSAALKGRAYDVMMRLDPLSQEERDFYLSGPDPFGG